MPIYFTHHIRRVRDLLNMVPPPLQLRPTYPPCLNHLMYNIRYGQGFILPQAIWAVQLGNYDLMLLTETNIPYGVYCHTA